MLTRINIDGYNYLGAIALMQNERDAPKGKTGLGPLGPARAMTHLWDRRAAALTKGEFQRCAFGEILKTGD
jgi:hypothetical protein